MLRKSAVVGMVVTALVLPAAAQETERTMPVRNFDRFELESETVNGLWAEAGAFLQRKTVQGSAKRDIDVTTAFARLAYGGSNKWEGDLSIPYHLVDKDQISGGKTLNVGDYDGIGDIQLSGKYVPVRDPLFDFGVGALVSLPSGDDAKALGSGEFGGMPFITGSLHLAVAEVRGHFGAEFFTGSNQNGQATDSFVYGVSINAPLGKYLALRNEFAGTTLRDLPGTPKAVSYLPGLDIRIPIGSWDVLLRPTAIIGMTDLAPDWGVGGSIVVTQ